MLALTHCAVFPAPHCWGSGKGSVLLTQPGSVVGN